jgi:hypothetical protein
MFSVTLGWLAGDLTVKRKVAVDAPLARSTFAVGFRKSRARWR